MDGLSRQSTASRTGVGPSGPASSPPPLSAASSVASFNFPSGGASSGTIVSQKLVSVLSASAASAVDDSKTQVALGALADFYGVNTEAKRRALRNEIERRSVAVNRNFLNAFGKLDQELAAIESDVNAMTECCEEIRKKLDQTNSQTASLIEQIDNLDLQSHNNVVRQTIMQAFLHRFTLSEPELAALNVDVDHQMATISFDFFEALTHLQRIRSDCKVLLVTEHQRAGLEIMESTAALQEQAYEKLYRWALAECKTKALGGDTVFGEAEVDVFFRKAIRALRGHETLFQSILTELVRSRQNNIVRSFLNALTHGSAGPPSPLSGRARPIELYAHDPLRFVGDMLAWLHQAVAGEREILESMFVGRTVGSARKFSLTSPVEEADDERDADVTRNDEELVRDLLDKNMEGTCRPLKARVEQVLNLRMHQGHPDGSPLSDSIVTTYKISNLMQFYRLMIQRLMGRRTAALVTTLDEATEMSLKVFYAALNTQAGELIRSVQAPGQDLQSPSAVKEVLGQLNQILNVYSNSLLTMPPPSPISTAPQSHSPGPSSSPAASASASQQVDLESTVSAVMDPILRACSVASESLESTWDKTVFMLNCLVMIEGQLAAFPFTEQRRLRVESEIDGQMEVLVDEQYTKILRQSGLYDFVEALLAKDPQTPLSTLPGLDAPSLSAMFARLDDFLVSLDVEVAQGLARLSNSKVAASVSRRACRKFVEAYGLLCRAVHDPASGYRNPKEIVRRDAREVEMILFGGA